MRQVAIGLLFLLGVLWSRSALGQEEANFSVQPKQLADVVEVSADITAQVRTEEGLGSGFYLNPLGGFITARHVIKLKDGSTAKHIRVVRAVAAGVVGGVILDGPEAGETATVVSEDAEHDLAFLRLSGNPFVNQAVSINGKDPFQPHHFAAVCPRTVTLRSGDAVFTVGYPLGDRRPITTAGIIASSQPTEFDAPGRPRDTYLVDMTINHGNSGGPVFSSAVGCVIGVADAIELTAVEAHGDENLSAVPTPILGNDGKPLLKDGKPMSTTLVYSSGLGILIPQRYVLELLDKSGGSKMPDIK